MKPKIVLTVAVVIGVLSLISDSYCFWLMTVPLSYKWVPVVVTGFLLATFILIISLITSLVVFIRLRRSNPAPNVSQVRPNT